MKAVLRPCRFFIWLAVFLFLYSSVLILIQYPAKEYPSRMISGWSSILGEFDQPYKALATKNAETAPESVPAAGAPAQKKPGEVPGYVSLMIWGGMVLTGLGLCWMIAIAFQENVLWGIVTMTIVGGPLFWVSHFRDASPPLALQLVGIIVVWFVSWHYGIDLKEYFLGSTPPPSAPRNPLMSPLEGFLYPLLMIS